MNRREFSLSLVGAAALAALGFGPVRTAAQPASHAEPVEGQQYMRLGHPVPIGEPGRIEVIEFFWYGCPHCNHFESWFEPWVAKQPKDVRVRRVHVGFNSLQKIHQQFFYTLEVMGVVDKVHVRVFHRFHDEHQPLNSLDDMVAWVASQGIDGKKFRSAWDSFSVQTRMHQASALAGQYDLSGVPTFAVQGRFKVDAPQAGAEAQTLRVIDWLVDRVRKGA